MFGFQGNFLMDVGDGGKNCPSIGPLITIQICTFIAHFKWQKTVLSLHG